MKAFKASLAVILLLFFAPNAARAMEVAALGDFMLSDLASSTGEQSNTHFSLGGGAQVNFDLTPMFQLEIGAFYLARQVGSSDTGLLGLTTFPYLTVPVLLRLPVGPVIFGLGGYYAYGVGQLNFSGSVDGLPISAQSTWSDSGVRRSDYGLVGAVGYRGEILPLIDLILDARYYLGLPNLDTSGAGTIRWRNVDLLVGLGFRI